MKAPNGEELMRQAFSLRHRDSRRAHALYLEAFAYFEATGDERATAALLESARAAAASFELEEAERLAVDVANRSVGQARQGAAYALAGEVAHARGAIASAHGAFRAAVQCEGTNAWRGHLGLARLYLEAGKQLEAEKALRSAEQALELLDEKQSGAVARANVAFEYAEFLESRRPSDALPYYKKALQGLASVELSQQKTPHSTTADAPQGISSILVRERIAHLLVRLGRTAEARRQLFSLLTVLTDLGRVGPADRVRDALRELGED